MRNILNASKSVVSRRFRVEGNFSVWSKQLLKGRKSWNVRGGSAGLYPVTLSLQGVENVVCLKGLHMFYHFQDVLLVGPLKEFHNEELCSMCVLK